jgi:hypothetical protein
MKNKIERMVNDITAIDPALSAKGKELEKIIGRLLSSKPRAKMNKSFRNGLRQEIQNRIKKMTWPTKLENPALDFFSWFKRQPLRLAAAASVFSLLLIATVAILPLFLQYQTDKQTMHENGLIVNKEKTGQNELPGTAPEKKAQGDLNLGQSDSFKNDLSPQTVAEERHPLRALAKEKEGEIPLVKSIEKETTRILEKIETGKDTGARDDTLIPPSETKGQILKDTEDTDISSDIAKTEAPLPLKQEEERAASGMLSEKAGAPAESAEMKAEDEQKKEATTRLAGYDFDFTQGFLDSEKNPLSTFPLNVGTSSYTTVRSYLENGKLPPPDTVRIEELLNYFDYQYPRSSAEQAISLFSEVAECPWDTEHKLLLIGIRSKGPDSGNAPPNKPESDKTFSYERSSQALPVAKEVKIQVKFNSLLVHSYRLLGYENHFLENKDFVFKENTGGELRSGQTVVVLYEIVPEKRTAAADSLKTQPAGESEMAILNLLYKKPDQKTNFLITINAYDANRLLSSASDNFRLAAAVAEWGLLLKDSPYKGKASLAQILELAGSVQSRDLRGRRTEFLKLLELSVELEASQ